MGENLVYASALVDICKDSKKRNWEPLSAENLNIYAQVNSLLSTYIEEFVKLNIWNEFCSNIIRNHGDSIWSCKFPLEKLATVARRMELPCNFYFQPNFELKNILEQIKVCSDVPTSKLAGYLMNKRKENPEIFHFDSPFNSLNLKEKNSLLDILETSTELIAQDPDFASVVSCWVGGWLKQAMGITHDKTALLWASKLGRCVVKLDAISKQETPFSEEYTEFHVQSLFPSVYTHFLQLAGLEEFWAIEASENVAEAVSLIPPEVLAHLLEESSKGFQLLTVVAQRKEVHFKIAAHALLSKLSLTKEILPREFELYCRKFQKEKAHADEAQVTYLLLWDVLLQAQTNMFELAHYVKEEHLLPHVLSLLFFQLLPESFVPSLTPLFETELILSPKILPSLPHLSASLLQKILTKLPYTTRWWWVSLRKQRDKAHVEKLTTKFLSAKLIAQELAKVKLEENGENIKVNSYSGCNELIARYKVDETLVILKVLLPLNHPLGPVLVSVSDKKLHARISQLLNTRSHSLAAGLRLWKESLDIVYKDADECAICFFILHHQTRQLPKLGCKTCKKKFHAPCLYKWFSTSNKSACPLCRNLW